MIKNVLTNVINYLIINCIEIIYVQSVQKDPKSLPKKSIGRKQFRMVYQGLDGGEDVLGILYRAR